MTNTTDHLNHNGFAIAKEFHHFMEESVIPATSLDSENFWNAFVNVIASTETDKTYTRETSDTFCEPGNPGLQVRECNHPGDAATSWGSLYDALYSDCVIPHSAGLKPGTGINAARRDRVIRCAKDYLDKTYPLTEGSHRDAVSYMVYCQNLLVILADGSTTGLQQPKQFVGKNGPTDKPDSILLEHNGTHTEILFDCNGHIGCTDLASIDDIQLEAVNHTLFDLTADSVSQKCSTYSNWMQIVKNRRCKVFSDRTGDYSSIECKNWAITTSANDNQSGNSTALVLNQHGNPVPEATIDALTAAIIHSAFTKGSYQLHIFASRPGSEINDSFIASLRQLLAFTAGFQKPEASITPKETDIKVFTTSADNPPQTRSRSRPAALHMRSPATSIIGTMQSHGYDVRQAASM